MANLLPIQAKPFPNAPAIVTIAGVGGKRAGIARIEHGYDRSPTGGALKVESPSGTVIWPESGTPRPIADSGAGLVQFNKSDGVLRGAPGEDMIVTLDPAGAGVQGRMDVHPVAHK